MFSGKNTLEEAIVKILKERFFEIFRENQEIQELIKEIVKKDIIHENLEKLNQQLLNITLEFNQKWLESNERWNKTLSELKELKEESERRWAENQRRWEENEKVIQSLLSEVKDLKYKFDVYIGAIGARWGYMSEASFRKALKGILEESFPVKVEQYVDFDQEGIVFGEPDTVELDLIIKNGEIIVVEIKSSLSRSDAYTFIKKVKFY